MRFAHIADSHLGFRQYGLYQREEDFSDVFKRNIDRIIEKKVDFVIHSGDLFHMSKPSPKTLLVFQEALLKLKENDIDVFAVAGNHDTAMRKDALPPQILSKNLGLELISPNKPYNIYEDIFIGGYPYQSKSYRSNLIDSINLLSKEAEKYERRILVLHQGIDKYIPFEFELEIADIPQNFNYYCLGHVHSRIVEDFGNGKLAYSGSTEICSKSEVSDYQKNGKGFYIVDISKKNPKIEKIDVKPKREFIVKHTNYPNLDNDISDLKEKIKNLDEKPILDITLEGGNFNRSDVYEKLINELGDLTLRIKSDLNPEQLTRDDEKVINATLNTKDLLIKSLSEYRNEDINNLAISLLDKLSKDKIDDAKRVAKHFYNEYFG
ncbi:MAG: DNA repair exonuclease [Methanobrevibacter sp.]|jgi:DNA repair exonuclease SbcCD nuclease subunit|nr:DNA repair exonuclease [Candidatus Methanovirga australis]